MGINILKLFNNFLLVCKTISDRVKKYNKINSIKSQVHQSPQTSCEKLQ